MSPDLAMNLGGEGDAWSRLELDPATCDLAEEAAARAGLSVEEWLEQAIRRSSLGRAAVPAPLVVSAAADDAAKSADLESIVMPEALLVPLEDEVIEGAADEIEGGESRTAKPFHRWAGRLAGALLAVAAGVISAQYLIPERGTAIHVALAPQAASPAASTQAQPAPTPVAAAPSPAAQAA
ncbi:MAG TPA: hypothetical protein VJR47_06365, partial [Stellaceae bacterium]|nr:hypothetical protein [Stellaceae bacterium]